MPIASTQVRPHDRASVAIICTLGLTIAFVLTGNAGWAILAGIATVGLGVVARIFSRQAPGPMPHRFRGVLFLPRGPHSSAHLHRILEPRAGERILEIGPGVGIHAVPMAAALVPGGVLEAMDAQVAMLADLEHRADRASVTNIVTTQGNAQRLPYVDRSFDAAYLIGVLGEVPDGDAALRELRRVLKPDGRLIIGEMVLDPDYVTLSALTRAAENAGFLFDRRQGPKAAYFARFVPGDR